MECPLDERRPAPAPGLDTTQLLASARSGDVGARDVLFSRFLPRLTAWAHRRLPPGARGLADTDDLVQVTLVRALNRLTQFEPRREGAFLAYLRTILLNVVREEIRRSRPLARREEIHDGIAADSRSQLEQVIGTELLERYEQGLAEMTDEQREAIVMRLEFGYSHAEIAEALGRPSANAARMFVARAIADLAVRLHDQRS